VLQYAVGAAVAPLVGAFGTATALPMAVVIGTLGCSALAVFVLLIGGSRSQASMTRADS
jgi:MFS transporter, DHA1 family, multidrug resistance protein